MKKNNEIVAESVYEICYLFDDDDIQFLSIEKVKDDKND